MDLQQYTPIVKIGDEYIVRLSVGHQSFDIFSVDDKADAEWMQKQLITALTKIVGTNIAAKDTRIAELETMLGKGHPYDTGYVEGMEKELANLRAWKDSALAVEREWDIQAVGKLIGVPLGQSIRSHIEPKIRILHEELAEAKVASDKRLRMACCEVVDLRKRTMELLTENAALSNEVAALRKRCEEAERERLDLALTVKLYLAGAISRNGLEPALQKALKEATK